jgi:hypothetical protein
VRSAGSFHIKDAGDLTIHVLPTIQLNDAPSQTVLISVFFAALHSSLQQWSLAEPVCQTRS